LANPQRENGHIDIANEIAEALAKTQLSGHESRVLWALFRETWGYVQTDKKGKVTKDKNGQLLKRKSAIITSKRWEQLTNLSKYNISRALRELQLRQMVVKFGKNGWGFQKDYDKWLPPIKEIIAIKNKIYFVVKNGNSYVAVRNSDNYIVNKIDNSIISYQKRQRKLSKKTTTVNKFGNKKSLETATRAEHETLKENNKESNIKEKKENIIKERKESFRNETEGGKPPSTPVKEGKVETLLDKFLKQAQNRSPTEEKPKSRLDHLSEETRKKIQEAKEILKKRAIKEQIDRITGDWWKK